ncbi:MAG: Hsp20/alpha crystallin family protein [Gammaproteobacteria bacterium]|nr:Hsp20/alpha crystallin family protein [Gammaproteobacteria bacterium]
MFQGRHHPLDELESLLALDRSQVEVPLGSHGDGEEVDWIPAVDVERGEDAYRIRLEVPGVRHEDVAVAVADGVLIAHGYKHAAARARGQGRLARRECSYGEFMRRFTLPTAIDVRAVRAELADGLLVISVPWRTGEAEDSVEVEIA